MHKIAYVGLPAHGHTNILDGPSYKSNAARLGETLRAAGGYGQAANEIERVIHAGTTQLVYAIGVPDHKDG